MDIIVGNPISPPPRKQNSHVHGWAYHLADLVQGKLHHKGDPYPNRFGFIWDHGVNFSGGLNLFGGLNDDVAKGIIGFVEAWNEDCTLYSCDIPMPRYDEMLKGRLGNATTSKLISLEHLEKLGRILDVAHTIDQIELRNTLVCIGDSHTASFARSGSVGVRKNGQTLFGALKSGYLERTLIDALKVEREVITLCFGSIDIRHHIMRQSDPKGSITKLIDEYKSVTNRIMQAHPGVILEYACPVPVEHESRKIPKTGFYKGEPFAGTRSQRLDMTMFWIDSLKRAFGEEHVVQPPSHWYTMDGELFARTHMEFGGSVHLSPLSYRRVNWGMADCFVEPNEETLDSIFN